MNGHISLIMNAFDLINDRVIALHEARVVYVNRAAAALFEDNPIGRTLASIIGDEHAAPLISNGSDCSLTQIDGAIIEGCVYNIRISNIEDILLLILTPDTENDSGFWTNYAMSAIGVQFRNHLNALLPAIRALPSMMPSGGSDERFMRYLAIMNHNCYKLQRLSNNLVDLAGFVNKDTVFNPVCGDIVEFCRRLVSEIRPLIMAKNIDINLKTTVSSALMDFDEDKIRRMLLNLISNSIKCTRDGNSITIKISKSDENVFITVADLGIGMSPEVLNKALRGFSTEQQDMVIEPIYGMGLPLVSAIARLHNGIVVLESRENVGTSVTVSLPVRTQNHDYVGNNRAEYDCTGGFSPVLVELSDVLPYYFYTPFKKTGEE